MNQDARVVKIENDKIMASCTKSACEGCKNSMFCKSKNNEFEVKNYNNINLSVGDEIQLDMENKKTVLASFMSLFLPLIFFFIGFIITYLYIAPENEIIQFVGAIVFLALGFGFSKLFFLKTRISFFASVVKKYEKNN